MSSQDIIKTGRKAKRETEVFINRYFNDQAKGWPIICLCGSAYTGYHREQQNRKPCIMHILPKNKSGLAV